jgi:hypothetical protein
MRDRCRSTSCSAGGEQGARKESGEARHLDLRGGPGAVIL